MRKTVLTTVTVLAIGGAAAAMMIANAQPAAPPAGPDGPPDRPHWTGWMRRGPERNWQGDRMRMMRNFALVYPQEDRKLTPPDVQKIAEAFLLWQGNHSWKVVEVAPTPDGAIGFALATPEGSVIARFTMDPHTARVTRTS